jgi:hypothetical protein
MLQKRSIYQDRLGTKIGQAEYLRNTACSAGPSVGPFTQWQRSGRPPVDTQKRDRTVQKSPFFAPFCTKNDPFTKTGSEQT